MSFELIKNYLYEKNTTPSNIYIELSSFKTFSYLLIDSLLTKSKTTFSIINFDPLYYRFCLSSGKSIPKTIFDSNQTFDTLQFDNNLIIIGADLLPSDSLNNFLQTFSQKKVGTVLFITNSQSKQKENSELIRNVCSLLLIENTFRKKDSSLYVKIDVFNLLKCTKDNIILEYLNNNNIIEQFTQIGLYSGEVKSLFEEIKKIAEHETTFNVKITEEELKQKNEVALPYIKTAEEKRKDLIEVDQDDIDELYEEDPDEDLDI